MMITTQEKNNLSRGYLVALISAAVLSTTAIFIRHLTEAYGLPALVLAMWRDFFTAAALLGLLAWLRPLLLKVERTALLYLVGYGFVLAIFNSFWTLSVALNGAAIATVLAYCSAGFTALLGWWLLHERLDRAKLLAVLLSLAGCVLVAEALDPAAWRANPLGIVTGILSGLFYAFYSLMGRSAAQRGLNPWSTVLYTFGFAGVFLLAINLGQAGLIGAGLVPAGLVPGAAVRLADLFWLGSSVAGWGILVLLAAGPTLAGFGLYNVSLGYLPSSVANLVVTTEPAFTAVLAYFSFGEMLNPVQIGGALLILAGVVFLRLHEGRLEAQRALLARG